MSEQTRPRIAPDIWETLETILHAANAGALDPTEIALPKRRTQVSPALDYLERELFANVVPPIDSPESDADAAALRREYSCFRLMRFFSLDNAEQLRATIQQVLGYAAGSQTEWRMRTILESLGPKIADESTH